MGDPERQDLAAQGRGIAAQIAAIASDLKKNTETTEKAASAAEHANQVSAKAAEVGNQILERLDGKLGKNGTMEGGLCALVENHDRFVKRREKYDWAAIVALLGALALVTVEHLWK